MFYMQPPPPPPRGNDVWALHQDLAVATSSQLWSPFTTLSAAFNTQGHFPNIHSVSLLLCRPGFTGLFRSQMVVWYAGDTSSWPPSGIPISLSNRSYSLFSGVYLFPLQIILFQLRSCHPSDQRGMGTRPWDLPLHPRPSPVVGPDAAWKKRTPLHTHTHKNAQWTWAPINVQINRVELSYEELSSDGISPQTKRFQNTFSSLYFQNVYRQIVFSPTKCNYGNVWRLGGGSKRERERMCVHIMCVCACVHMLTRTHGCMCANCAVL